MIRPILQVGNEVLRAKSLPVTCFTNESLDNLIENLAITLQNAQTRFRYGKGIAAPQIGELNRVIVINTPRFTGPLINPKIVLASDEKVTVWDSCFSFDVAFFVLVDRKARLQLNYQDRTGRRLTLDAAGSLLSSCSMKLII